MSIDNLAMNTARSIQPPLPDGVKLPIYMDNHATTPMDPRVLDEMLPYFVERFGNAASHSHSFGWTAEQAVETARERIAKLIGATANGIIFTSGATESDNLAIKGIAEAHRTRGNHIITALTEHKAVLDSCLRLEKSGYKVTYLPVQKDGLIDLDDLKRALTDQTILVTIMAANNEIGVLQPVAEIGKLCRERGVFFHSDATQAVGKIPINVCELNIDLLSISAHKMYGPKGIGALYVRRAKPQVDLAALIDGGGHEYGMRSGTLNVPGIVGLGKACAIAQQDMPEDTIRIRNLRERLRNALSSSLDNVSVNGSLEKRLAGNLNVSFAGIDGESLMLGVSEVAVSTGSACSSAGTDSSHVLKAIGLSDDLARSSIRFGLGRFNTDAEVDYVASRVSAAVQGFLEVSRL